MKTSLKIKDIISLRKLASSELSFVCLQLREEMVEVVAQNGGHLSASLGATELAVGIHYVFNTPKDNLVWDVGHQAYAHKILTERDFSTLRKKDGISGFPKRDESTYDSFGTGHSSTSISAALGMAVGSNDVNQQHIAVIGDGAITGGMAFEALNHASTLNVNLKIILNDNTMSIDENVGSLNQSGKYKAFFESLNIPYLGEVNGNDLNELIPALKKTKEIKGPVILHCKTIKGFGYQPSEEGDKTLWHAPPKFDSSTGKAHLQLENLPPKYQDVFGETMLELARQNNDIVAVTPAMLSGSSLTKMQAAFPDRVFDVGIAEQHAITFSAGMATQGKKVYCHLYSTFLQRGYDQLIHDVALQNLPIVFCVDRAGFVGEDGSTHHGLYDIAFLRCIPNLIIASPYDEVELRNLLYTAQFINQPMVIRYPRGRGQCLDWQKPFKKLEVGKAETKQQGSNKAILSFGPIGNEAEGIKDVTHINMLFVKPLDEKLLHEICSTHSKVITLEEGAKIGGFGSRIAEFITQNNYSCKLIILGVNDVFVEHTSQKEQREEQGLTKEMIKKLL